MFRPCPLCLRDLSGGHRIGKFGPAHPQHSVGVKVDAEGGREFLLTLRLRERMALNQQFNEWIRMTTVRPRNLKAAFFAAGHRTTPGKPKGRFGRAFNELSDAYKHIADALSPEGPPTVQRALLMYDIAGETAERYADQTIAEHDADMDVLAVLVSAEDL